MIASNTQEKQNLIDKERDYFGRKTKRNKQVVFKNAKYLRAYNS